MKKLLVILCLGYSFSTFAQSPWLYKKNEGFFQVYTTLLAGPYDTLAQGVPYDDTTNVNINRETRTTDFGVYLQYGISDVLNLVAKIPFQKVETGDLTENQNPNFEVLEPGSEFGLSNVEIGLKHGLIDKKIKVAVSVNTIWNTISKDLSKGLATGFDYNAFGALGHVGTSFGKSYVYTDVGYVYTTNDFSDYFQQHIEYGYAFTKAFTVNATLDFRRSIYNGTNETLTLQQTGLHPNNQEWVGFGFGAMYELENKLGFNFWTGGAIAGVKYIGFTPPVTLGVYKKF